MVYALQQTAFYTGALSDASGQAWNSIGAPWIYCYGQPSWTNYYVGQILFDGADGKIYRNTGYPNGWVKTADPADLIAGTLAAGVILGGSADISSGSKEFKLNATDGFKYTDTDLVVQILAAAGTLGTGGIAATKPSTGCTLLIAPGGIVLSSVNPNPPPDTYGSIVLGFGGMGTPHPILKLFNGLTNYFSMDLSPTTGAPLLSLGAANVLTIRQTGPGNTTDSTDVAVRFNNLLTALRAHGLIT